MHDSISVYVFSVSVSVSLSVPVSVLQVELTRQRIAKLVQDFNAELVSGAFPIDKFVISQVALRTAEGVVASRVLPRVYSKQASSKQPSYMQHRKRNAQEFRSTISISMYQLLCSSSVLFIP